MFPKPRSTPNLAPGGAPPGGAPPSETLNQPSTSPDAICPVTGLPMVCRPEWTDVDLGNGYTVTFKFICKRILLTQARSTRSATRQTVERLFALRDQVLADRLADDEPYLELRDYSGVKRFPSREVRGGFKDRMEAHRFRLLGYVGYASSPRIRLAVSFGQRLYKPPFPVLMVRDYEAAVKAAVEILQADYPAEVLPPRRHVTSPDWNLEDGDFRCSYEVIDEKILFSRPSGLHRDTHAPVLDRLRERVRAATRGAGGFDYIIADLEQLEHVSRKGRKASMDYLRQWHARYPFRLYVVCGVNRILRAAIAISRPFLPFPIRIAKDLDQAMRLVRADMLGQREQRSPIPRPPVRQHHARLRTERYAAELLRYIGNVNWESRSLDFRQDIPESHPFRPVFDGIAFIGSELDDLVREREGAALALEESEARYRSIIENISDGYFEVDLKGNVLLFNESFCKMLGYSHDEMLQCNYRDLIADGDVDKAIQYSSALYETGRPLRLVGLDVVRRDGSRGFFEASATLTRDSDGKPTGFRGLARDMTERRQMEQEKAYLEEKLESGRRMEIMGTLAGGVAHDLNNILSAVVSYPDLLLMDLPPDSDLRESVLTIKQSGEKAAAVVEDLLTLARRGVGSSTLTNLNRIIQKCLASPGFQALKAEYPGVEVETRLDAALLNTRGSPTHLARTVMNLMSNAAEAMAGGGKVVVSTTNRYHGTDDAGGPESRQGDYVVLEVTDTGAAISRQDQARLFEPFYTKKVLGRSGTGLGLAVVWATVKDHQGHIQVESRAGEGTTFVLYFPATREGLAEDRALAV